MDFANIPPNPFPIKKRRKGATRLSCAECRRLKLRCDRAVPCGSCVKRGCGAICPDGSLTTGQGNRFVLASTQELHEKIQELANRVRQLEDALRETHIRTSTEPHPLLSEELLKIKAPLQREPQTKRSSSAEVKEEEHNPDLVDAVQSLSISSGKERFYGQTANSWLFLQNELREESSKDERLERVRTLLPLEILNRASMLPMSPQLQVDDGTYLRTLLCYLPTADRAYELRSIYYSYAAWMYNPISTESFDSQVYNQFYPFVVGSTSYPEPILYHQLSLMFIILAIGSLMDTSLPAYSLEAEKYHQLSRAALFHDAIFDEPTMNAVQALFLMTFYLFLADRHCGNNSGVRWSFMGIVVKLAQSIGLHRDGGRWNATDKHARRELFWELFTYDSWQCHSFGRPPSFALAHVDTKMPFAHDTSDEQAYHAWKHRFTSECMNLLHDQAFGARMPTYATVLQLDRKMRAFPVPPVLQVAGFGNSESRTGGYPETPMLTLQRHVVLAIRETNLLYLHRSFFARAISDQPKDPLGSPYGASVIAAYRSAASLVALMRNLHTQLREPSERIWFLWTHMFSCAIVLGSIVTRCPSLSLAPSALQQLDSACDLFSKAAHGFRADKVLEIMIRLREKAHYSLNEFRKGNASPLGKHAVPLSMSPESNSPVEEDDELSMLGGKPRFVKKESFSPTITQSSVVPLPLTPSMETLLNPSLVEYLGTFPVLGQSHVRHNSAPTPLSPYTDVAPMSAVSSASSYGMAPMPSSPTFHHHEMGSFIPSQQQHLSPPPRQQFSRQPQPHIVQQQQHNMGSGTQAIASPMAAAFPQFFPVYDYPVGVNEINTVVDDHGGVNGYEIESAAMDVNPQHHHHHHQHHHERRQSTGSEGDGNMQAWQDLLMAEGMMM